MWGKSSNFAAIMKNTTKTWYELITELQQSGEWNWLLAGTEWAYSKNRLYFIYKLVNELEPERKYGYKTRFSNWWNSANNRDYIKSLVGAFDFIDGDSVKYAIQEMERKIVLSLQPNDSTQRTDIACSHEE